MKKRVWFAFDKGGLTLGVSAEQVTRREGGDVWFRPTDGQAKRLRRTFGEAWPAGRASGDLRYWHAEA